MDYKWQNDADKIYKAKITVMKCRFIVAKEIYTSRRAYVK